MRIKKSLIAFAGAFCALECLYSCTDWGQMDPPAGNQVYPTREEVAQFNFNENDTIDSLSYLSYRGTLCEIVHDDSLNSRVLHVSDGQVTMSNQLTKVKLQNGAALIFWMRTPKDALEATVLSVGTTENATDNEVQFSSKGALSYKGTKAQVDQSSVLNDSLWHYVAVQVINGAYDLWIDGTKTVQGQVVDETKTEMVNTLNTAPYITLGCEGAEVWIDDFKAVRNQMNSKDPERPTIKRDNTVKLPTPVYYNDFTSTAGLTIVGSGYFRNEVQEGFGQVFQNVASASPRQNYLLLPEDVLSHSAETQQMTIGFWVNAANAGSSTAYMWAPMFMAYGAEPVNGENTWPMFACQYRGVLQLNCNGWTDYTDAQNVAGVNTLYHNETDWLTDKQWHYYSVVFDNENAKVYFDGEVVNEWNMDGATNTQRGLFNNGGDLKYVCLGGNQAWGWADNDPGFAFDDIAIYDEALTPTQIQYIMSIKKNGGVAEISLPEYYYRNTFDNLDGISIVGGGTLLDRGDNHGKVFQNVASAAPRQNYLLLPEDVLAHSAETQQLSMSVWVNAADAGESSTYMWAPLFTAYSQKNDENTWPMLACQYRGVLQLNCSGWTDYTDAQNVAGVNAVYHDATDWLADKQWHLYTVVFDNENAKVYFDGVVVNEWNMDGAANTQRGLFNNGGDLKYVCLGGNQAWGWADNDPGFAFDDIMFFDFALTPTDIAAIMSQY